MLEWRPPALTNTPLSHTHTASPRLLARTTRTRNETETNFPIGGLLRRLIPLNLRYGNSVDHDPKQQIPKQLKPNLGF